MASERRVVLFGRTGAGKSTVANVLVTGGIEQPMVFPASDAPTGCTSEIITKSGRGWTVVDTIGLGEAESGTRSHEEAQLELKSFLKQVRDAYSHIIFVQKASRMTELDKVIWTLFAKIFEGAEDAFVVLFTDATDEWLEENRTLLPPHMGDYEKFAVNIPPISDKLVRERRNKVARDQSLQELEQKLIAHFARRGNKPSVPNIATMNDEQLESTAEKLMALAIRIIRECIDPTNWLRVASRIGSWFDVMDAFSNVLN